MALVPETVGRLTAGGFEVAVERGAGAAAGLPGRGLRRRGRDAARGRQPCSTAPRRSFASAGPRPTRSPRSQPGTVLIGFLAPLTDRGGHRAPAPPGRRRLRDGVGAADLARPVHGRPLLAGQRRRLQGRADRGRPRAEALPDADDRGRHDRAGPRARDGRGRRRPAGDRDRAPARRSRLGVRRAAGGEGTGRVARARSSSSSACRARRPRAATRRS